MRLHTREWGTGGRVAVLVHGIMTDHRTWHRVGPVLADRGYRAVAVDLRGHGVSGRGGYGAESWADDVVETLPDRPELAIGHSLGALVLSRAVERLAPTRAVYCDPAWELDRQTAMATAGFAAFKLAGRTVIRSLNPRWDDADVETEAAALGAWDPATAQVLPDLYAVAHTPARPAVPSLVVLAGTGGLVRPALGAELARRGFEVRTVEGTGHTVYRDDLAGFVTALDGWI